MLTRFTPKFWPIFTLLLLVVGFVFLPSTVFASKFYFNPGNGSVISTNCTENSLAIMLDPQSLNVNAADVDITYNPNDITLIDQNPIVNGTQIKIGTAFESYRGNLASGNHIILTGNSFLQNLNTLAPFAYIIFKPKAGVLTTSFTIRFDGVGATLDSNIAQAVTNLDVLTSVENATVNFAATPCPVTVANDTVAPIASLVSPPNQSTDNPLSSNVVLRIQDASTGVNLQSLEVTVNSIKYTLNSSELSYTGTPNDYQVTINPAVDFPAGQLIEVKVSVRDLADNLLLDQFEFNNPSLGISPDTTEPVISLITPTDGSHNNALDTNIELRIRDTGIGVDLSNLLVLVDGQEYHLNSPGFSYIGTTKDYIVKINPTTDLPANKKIVVDVTAKDLLGNTAVKLFSFNQPPQDIVQTITQSLFEPSAHPFIDTPLAGTIIETFVAQNGAASLINTVFTSLLLFNLLSFVNFLIAPRLLTEIIGILFGKRPAKTWGVVYDAQTKRPVAFAVVRLYVSATLTIVDEKVTDLEGRYGFTAPAGKYRVEVQHAEYQKATIDLDTTLEAERIGFDIRLVPITNTLSVETISWPKKLWKSYRRLLKKLSPYLFTIGFMSSLISVTLAATIFNLGIFFLYLILLVLSIPAIFPRQPKSSMVIDSKTDLRVPSAVVKIFNPTTWEIVDSQLTSAAGLFDFWGTPGEYALLVSARGYKFPSDRNADLPRITHTYDSMLKVRFRKGNNQLKIYIDPIGGQPTLAELIEQKKTGNLASPFAT
jgi:hypothetical protein